MAVRSGFYNSMAHDRKYNAADMSKLFNGIINDGIFMTVGTKFETLPASGMAVTVGTGRAWFDSTWTDNDSPLLLSIAASDVTLNRIDAVVLEVNRTDEVRANTIKVVKGTAAATPSKPVFTNADKISYWVLAYITIPAGAVSISAANIENRVGTSNAPYITAILETTDVDQLYTQWEAQFNAWFRNLKNQLDVNQAGNLQNQINKVKTILGETAPTNSTFGDVGQLYLNVINQKLYKCVGENNNFYSWAEVDPHRIGDVRITARTQIDDTYILCNGANISPEEFPNLCNLIPGELNTTDFTTQSIPWPDGTTSWVMPRRIFYENGHVIFAFGNGTNNFYKFAIKKPNEDFFTFTTESYFTTVPITPSSLEIVWLKDAFYLYSYNSSYSLSTGEKKIKLYRTLDFINFTNPQMTITFPDYGGAAINLRGLAYNSKIDKYAIFFAGTDYSASMVFSDLLSVGTLTNQHMGFGKTYSHTPLQVINDGFCLITAGESGYQNQSTSFCEIKVSDGKMRKVSLSAAGTYDNGSAEGCSRIFVAGGKICLLAGQYGNSFMVANSNEPSLVTSFGKRGTFVSSTAAYGYQSLFIKDYGVSIGVFNTFVSPDTPSRTWHYGKKAHIGGEIEITTYSGANYPEILPISNQSFHVLSNGERIMFSTDRLNVLIYKDIFLPRTPTLVTKNANYFIKAKN